MNTKKTPQAILDQLASIDRMETGKLCVMRQGPNGPYYKHQCWRNGRNVTEYVPAEEVEALRSNIECRERFDALVGEYGDLVAEISRSERKDGDKKKRPPRKSPSPSRGKRKSKA